VTLPAPKRGVGHAARDSSGRPATLHSRRARRFAHGIALALLDGEWTPKAARARVEQAVGAPAAWIARLVRRVRTRFSERPGDDDDLRRMLCSDRGLGRVWVERRPRIVRWYTPTITMTPRWGVPAWPTTGDVAAALAHSSGELSWYADRRGWERRVEGPLRHYRYAWAPKKAGGHRMLETPKPRLKELQRRILHRVLDAIPPHPAAVGFRRGRSVRDHAEAHVGAPVLLRMDFEDFFLTTRGSRVVRVFRAAGYPSEVAYTLAGLCTNVAPANVRSAPLPADPALLAARNRAAARLAGPHLPQGAPTSPALANLCAWRLDRRLAGLAHALRLTYTRYADDLAFSGALSAHTADGLAARVAAISAEEGYTVNHRKTRVMRASQRQIVGGIVVNERPNVPRPDYDLLKATLHNCVRHGPSEQNREALPDFRGHLAGRVAWVTFLNPFRGAKLQALLDRIVWGER
jgi:RNA-directed DNA polymerase